MRDFKFTANKQIRRSKNLSVNFFLQTQTTDIILYLKLVKCYPLTPVLFSPVQQFCKFYTRTLLYHICLLRMEKIKAVAKSIEDFLFAVKRGPG